jgi:hypothetical protein
VVYSTEDVFYMADEGPNDISSMTVIGIGVVIFVVIVGAWYLFLK